MGFSGARWGQIYMQTLSRCRTSRQWLIGLCVSFGIAGCGPEGGPTKEQVTVTEFGRTCGEWQVAKDAQRIVASCGDGLECTGWFASYPDEQVGNRYGRCLPATAVCDASDLTDPSGACPDERLTCLVGLSAAPPGACFVHCDVPQDCPGPFQVCISGGCQFQACGEGSCNDGAHCENEVCVPD